MVKSDFIFRYRFRTWPDYDQSLLRRGSISFWIGENALPAWRHCILAIRRHRPGESNVFAVAPWQDSRPSTTCQMLSSGRRRKWSDANPVGTFLTDNARPKF